MDCSFSAYICRRCVFHRRHFSAEKFETSDALVNLKELRKTARSSELLHLIGINAFKNEISYFPLLPTLIIK